MSDADRAATADRLRLVVPEALRSAPGWLLWRLEPKPGGDKPAKVPYYVDGRKRHGTQGGPEDRAALGTFDAALGAFEAGGFDGIGLAMLPDWGLVGLDFDRCADEDGAIRPEVLDLVKDTYAEYSPSGRGVRAFYRGSLPDRKNLAAGAEVFHAKGYLTVTGRVLNGTDAVLLMPDAVRSRLVEIVGGANEITATARRVEGEIADGSRNATLTSLAGSMRNRGMTADEIDAALQTANAQRCRPPLDPAEVRAIAKSVAQYEPAAEADGPDAQAVARLAKMSPMEYDRCRRAEAEALGVRTDTLDAQVKKARGDAEADVAGAEVVFPERAPWPAPVPGDKLLSALAETLRRFVILPPTAADAVALWVVFTYCIAAVHVAPILAVASPEKRCGKSTLLEFLIRLCHRALPSSNISPPAVFRSIEKWAPTLIIDEADTFLRESEEMRGVLNSGHTRSSAFVIRTVGDDFEPRRFATWGPKAVALIGKLPDTLHDRSIVIELRRKLADEKVEKLRHAGHAIFDDLARQCARFAADHAKLIGRARPAIPDELNDRAADNWEPLLAIAAAAGGEWPERARCAALELSGEAGAVPASLAATLLADIRDCFQKYGEDRMTTAVLLDKLRALDERPWGEYKHGKPLNAHGLSTLLSRFGIKSKDYRFGDGPLKGFALDQFADAFRRYLPGSEPQHRDNPIAVRVSGHLHSATDSEVLRTAKPPEAAPYRVCSDVADLEGGSGLGAGEAADFEVF